MMRAQTVSLGISILQESVHKIAEIMLSVMTNLKDVPIAPLVAMAASP
jgi:hypothetical protein